MKSHARVVVVGGGVVGASVLYHLAKRGWTDTVLVERLELTSGSSWHAAGGFHTLNGDPNVAKLQSYTVKLYAEIEAASGQSCGFHMPGGLMLADTPARMDFLKLAHAKGRYLGMDTAIISAAEAQRMMPMLDASHFVGAMYDPLEGHLDPSGTTHAYAGAARKLGCEIYRHTRVVELQPRTGSGWDVITDKGTIVADHVVNAGGLWAREVGRMVGIELPVLAMEHMYLITEDMPEVAALNQETGREQIQLIDFAAEIYTRQEGKGMLVGTYEQDCRPWQPDTTPWDFGPELLPEDLERIAPSLEIGFRHIPALAKAGIKRVVNGPFTFTPDGNPLVGPVQGLRNYWCACGVMAGFSQGGGVGLALANWIVDGDPGFDVWGMDVARYGQFATKSYTNVKVRENYSRRFRIRFPNEELPAARPLRTAPVHDTLIAANAVFGVVHGLEWPLWFAAPGDKPEEAVTYGRSNAFAHVGAECAAVRSAVGLMEASAYGRFMVEGPDAVAFLDYVLAGKIPTVGRMVLSPMLNDAGKLIGDLTVARLGLNQFFLVGSSVAERFYLRRFEACRGRYDVTFRSLLDEQAGLAIAGPRARELLARVTSADLANAAFPFMAVRRIDVGLAPCIVGRVSFTGELGYEIWMSAAAQRAVFDALTAAGVDLGLRLFGGHALNALRLEKGFGSWAREYRPIYSPVEAGLDRFVKTSDSDFAGKASSIADQISGGERRLVLFDVDARDADAFGDEPIWHEDKVVGWITSGGYGHTVGKSLALGYVPRDLATATSGFQIEIVGERRAATVLAVPPVDPKGSRMRG